MLAEAVHNTSSGPFKDVSFNEQEMYELRIAAWLHDCGKVTTPEYVVDKATKLETIYDRVETVALRFEIIRRDEEIKFIKKKNRIVNDQILSKAEKKNLLVRARKLYRKRMQQLDTDVEFIRTTNIGGEFMSDDKKDRVKRIARYRWKKNGSTKPLLDENEVYNLMISRGTLTNEEREKINDHIVMTIEMLEQLPYPKHLRNVPEFAGGHHEKLDGTGYPKGLKKDDMSIQARMMAIADIFEALTARDRPYKKGKTLSQAMRILGFMKNDNHIDPDLFEIFIDQKIYQKYAEENLDPSQIDEVQI